MGMYDNDYESEDYDIEDLDDLWEFDDYDLDDLQEYEFHGTGDTGGE